MRYTLTGACPRCGAPIFATGETDGPIFTETPTAHFTCECRKTLPEPLPELDGEALETTAEADLKHLARHRKDEGREPVSGEVRDDG